MFNKKDEQRRNKKEELDKINTQIKELNERINENTVALDKENRMLNDKNLAKKKETQAMQLKTESNKISIDINIDESRIKELEGLREMTLKAIDDLMHEKIEIEFENEELENKISGKALSDQERNQAKFDAEKE